MNFTHQKILWPNNPYPNSYIHAFWKKFKRFHVRFESQSAISKELKELLSARLLQTEFYRNSCISQKYTAAPFLANPMLMHHLILRLYINRQHSLRTILFTIPTVLSLHYHYWRIDLSKFAFIQGKSKYSVHWDMCIVYCVLPTYYVWQEQLWQNWFHLCTNRLPLHQQRGQCKMQNKFYALNDSA